MEFEDTLTYAGALKQKFADNFLLVSLGLTYASYW